MTECELPLPCQSNVASSTFALKIVNSGVGVAILAASDVGQAVFGASLHHNGIQGITTATFADGFRAGVNGIEVNCLGNQHATALTY